MFGGARIYKGGVMFALLDDMIYMRVDDGLQAELKALGSVPWTSSMKPDGSIRRMGYCRSPETAADDPDEAIDAARRAFTAAVKRKTLRGTKPRARAARKATGKVAKAKKWAGGSRR